MDKINNIGNKNIKSKVLESIEKKKGVDSIKKGYLKLYHGTPYDFKEFKNQISFFTTSEEFAFDYANEKSFDGQMDQEPKIHTRFLNKEINIFNSKNEKHFETLKNELLKSSKQEYTIGGTWGGYKVSKEQFLDELRGISWYKTPKFIFKEDYKVGDLIKEEYDMVHRGLWRVKNIKENGLLLEKLLKHQKKEESVYSWQLLDKFGNWDYYSKNIQEYMDKKGYHESNRNRDGDLVFYTNTYEVLSEQFFEKKEIYKKEEDIHWGTFEGDGNFIETVKKLGFEGIKMKEKKADTYMIFEPNRILEKKKDEF